MLIKWIKARMDERDERDHKMKCMESMECMENKRSNDEKTVHLTESTCALSNPGCGWYHLYSFDLAEESFLYIACEEEELVLLRIDIHAFRSCKQIPKEVTGQTGFSLSLHSMAKASFFASSTIPTDMAWNMSHRQLHS